MWQKNEARLAELGLETASRKQRGCSSAEASRRKKAKEQPNGQRGGGADPIAPAAPTATAAEEPAPLEPAPKEPAPEAGQAQHAVLSVVE